MSTTLFLMAIVLALGPAGVKFAVVLKKKHGQKLPTPQARQKCRRFYKGASSANASEIYSKALFMVGDYNPRGVWITNKIKVAKRYCGKNGNIVLLDVSPGLPLKNLGFGVFVYEIPGAKPYQDYYQIKGLTPVGLLDSQGNRIR